MLECVTIAATMGDRALAIASRLHGNSSCVVTTLPAFDKFRQQHPYEGSLALRVQDLKMIHDGFHAVLCIHGHLEIGNTDVGLPIAIHDRSEDHAAYAAANGLQHRLQSFGSLKINARRSEEHTSELQSQSNLVCRLLLEKKKKKKQ